MSGYRLGVLAFLLSACGPSSSADLVLVDGRIVTLDEDLPEIEGVAVQDGRIVDIGSRERVLSWVGPETRVLDLNGLFTTPGWIESHAHFIGLGEARLQLDLTQARTWDEIVAMVAEAAGDSPEGSWILGRGWHQEKWQESPEPGHGGLPYHDELSRRVPSHPVLLTHASGHAAFANTMAMELAGIDAGTPNPEGGEIVKDAGGRLLGVFRENAEGPLWRAYHVTLAGLNADELRQRFQKIVALASQEAVSNGITTFHDAGSSFAEIDQLQAAVDAGRLPLRLYVMLSESNQSIASDAGRHRLVGYGGDRLTVRAIKRYMDGALGSHGAWLKEPYSDLPSSVGLKTTDLEALEETAKLAAELDFQLCIHAIGDRANAEVLSLYERVLQARPGLADPRWRIEHAQHIDPADIEAFARFGVIAAMQSIHAVSDGPWVPVRLGEERARIGAYPWRSLLDAGATVCNGSDAPVEAIDPLAGFHAAVTRRIPGGESFYPEQSMTRPEALHSYTRAGAYAAFEENLKGSITVGKLADFTVFSGDLLTVPDDRIRDVRVVYTIVGGEVVYENPKVQ